MIVIVGWASSCILLLTLITHGTHKGVSKWLFIGQLAASVGFTIYSIDTGNTVFIITNSFLLVSAMIGIYIYFHQGSK